MYKETNLSPITYHLSPITRFLLRVQTTLSLFSHAFIHCSMIKYLTTHTWKIVEEGFNPKHQRSSESIFSIGNGRFGQRANHEETYTGPTLQGSYVAGVYYPDKTRVGWWKNGYPE